MSTNAFTIPKSAFTEAERRAMRQQAAGQRGGQTRREQDHGQIYVSCNPAPKAKDQRK